MQLKKERSVLQDYHQAVQCEWLETNGLGGWASSSIVGSNTRRYHGLLVAATVPPAERVSLVSKLEETIVLNGDRLELGVNNFGDIIHPNGNRFQVLFTRGLFPEFVFEVGGIRLKKTVAMVHGENTTLVVYDVISAARPFHLELLPLLSGRGYHGLMHANEAVHRDVNFSSPVFQMKVYEGLPDIFIKVPRSEYYHNPNWWYHFNYEIERYRGLDFVEDLFAPGNFSIELKEGDSLGVVLSTSDPSAKDAHELLAAESLRRQLLLNDEPGDETLQQLTLAADQFIVRRGADLKTVIAGYHWFTDWGRDTMISLPGLCLSTGRLDDAKKILAAFAGSVSQGMLPNRFQDNGEAPEYNNVDGTLWYFVAVHRYLQAGGDKQFVLNDILPVLRDIVEWHHKGTRYHIHDEADGLLYSGEDGVQLTWMDAKIGDWVVTPRTGKAVEVNALWYNALRVYAELLGLDDRKDEARAVNDRADFTRRNFNELFWNEKLGYLYDVIEANGEDDTLRPNQLFAIGLPYQLVDGERAKSVLAAVTKSLYTPVGLRSLPPDHPKYVGVYGGDALHRDSSYHQGTVWSWLLGIYVDAVMKVAGAESRTIAKRIIENLRYHLNEGCIGSVSEIFDGDAPHFPRGCIAQAWGVGEILRVLKDYELYSPRPSGVQVKLNETGKVSAIEQN